MRENWLQALASATQNRDAARAKAAQLTHDESEDLRWAAEVFSARAGRIISVLVRRYGWQGE
jgi:hypothetical protein